MDIQVITGTKDLQTVSISLRILQQPIVEKLPEIHQLLGKEYEKKIFKSIGQEILRTIVAQCILPLTQMMLTSSSSLEKPSANKLETASFSERSSSM